VLGCDDNNAAARQWQRRLQELVNVVSFERSRHHDAHRFRHEKAVVVEIGRAQPRARRLVGRFQLLMHLCKNFGHEFDTIVTEGHNSHLKVVHELDASTTE
jgi:hypothetical protein